jgi:hypothetical protein
MASRGGRNSH